MRFDSPTLGPHFHIPRPIALLLGHIALGCVASHWVASHHIGLRRSMSGRVTVRRVMSQHVGSHHSASGRITARQVALCRVASHQVRSVALLSGWLRYYQVGCAIIGLVVLLSGWLCYYRVGHTIIVPIWCTFPPCFCPAPLHTLPHHSLQRFNLYLHTSLFSFCHCDPGHLPLTLGLPYPCHLSLHHF